MIAATRSVRPMRSLHRIVIGVVAALAIAVPVSAHGAVGWVEHTELGCDYFIVDAPSGYAVLEWFGGAFPWEGQRVVGRFESFGFKNVRIGRRYSRVWVEDYWLDQDSAYSVMYSNC